MPSIACTIQCIPYIYTCLIVTIEKHINVIICIWVACYMYTVDIVAYDEASELDYWKPYFEVEKSQIP